MPPPSTRCDHPPGAAHRGRRATVYIAGDSTVQTYDPIAWAPQAGWGQMIDRFFDDDVDVREPRDRRRSSKNFISQGRLDEILRACARATT